MCEILDHPLIARRYFYPRRWPFPSPFLVEVPGATLACALHRAGVGAPTVIHFHGNGEVVAGYLHGFPERFTALGWNLLLAEYRGYGMSTGEPLLGTMLEDVAHIVRAVDSPPEQVVAFGRSVGSIFAIEAAARFPRLAGLVLESGVADPLERLLMRLDPAELEGGPDALVDACARRLDHRTKLGSYPGPLLVLHALHDDLVPVDNAERLSSWAGGRATARLLPRGDHNSILQENEDEYFEAVAAFLGLVSAPWRLRLD